MTPKQKMLYWRLVKQATQQFCREYQIPKITSQEASVLRHDWHVKALGYDASANDLTNDELDKVFAFLRLVANPDSFDAALGTTKPADDGTRKRYLYALRKMNGPYVAAECLRKFDTRDPEDLSTEDLRVLVIHCKSRKAAMSAARTAAAMTTDHRPPTKDHEQEASDDSDAVDF